MSSVNTNHLTSLLDVWFEQKDNVDWVLATIIEIDGSSYRKPGAMMFINGLGQYFGLLSGGCLEADIMRQARKCWDSGNNHVIQYDMRDEDDIAWKLGIGCGGMVRILLQPISSQNNYLELMLLRQHLSENNSCFYLQQVQSQQPDNQCLQQLPELMTKKAKGLHTIQEETWFIAQHKPAIRLAIFGGGMDAIPLVTMAKQLGWHVTVLDERLGYAKESFFSDVDVIIREKLDALANHFATEQWSAIVLMNHNVKMDAKSLLLALDCDASYVGMLGPSHRTERVFNEAGLTAENLRKPLFNPVGLDLGGELPESIALSILSEIHATLFNADAQTLTRIKPAQQLAC